MNKTLIILANFDIANSNTAARKRMELYAKALTFELVRIYFLCWTKKDKKLHIWSPRQSKPIEIQHRGFDSTNLNNSIYSIINSETRNNVSVLLYPTTNSFFDIKIWYELKRKNYHKVFYELNEIRRYDINTLHQIHKFVHRRIIKDLGKYLLFLIIEFLWHQWDGIVAISTAIEKLVANYNDTVLRIPILVDDTEKLKPMYLKSVKPEKLNICFAGSINIKKENLDLLLKALGQVQGFQLNLYGPVDQANEIEINKLVNNLQLTDRVFIKGTVNQDKILDIYRQHDLLILVRGRTLQNTYGFSTKLSEYLMSGIPVLATNVGDNKLYLKDGINSWVIDPDNLNELIDKLVEIRKTYQSTAPQISQQAYYTAIQHFSVLKYSKVLAEFFFPPS